MAPLSVLSRAACYLFLLLAFLVVIAEWAELHSFHEAAGYAVIPAVLLLTPLVPWKRRLFVVIALALAVIAVVTRPDVAEVISRGLYTAAFIAAFFVSLSMLSDASSSAASLEKAGLYLTEQPPGWRYLALTTGGHLFGLCLSYGSVALLGKLAETTALREPDAEIRGHRLRRMLLAVQRGFVSTIAWSPLGFSMAMSTTLVPGATWAGAVAPCLISAALLGGVGWALDTIFKPRLAQRPAARAPSAGRILDLWPLFALLFILAVAIGGLNVLTGHSVVSIVMLIVPVISLIWIALQNLDRRPVRTVVERAAGYVSDTLPRYRTELMLLPTAGFIGVVGAALVKPVVAASGVDLTAVSPALLLIALVWIFPLAGQIGMNPILTVSLVAPLLPDPALLGVSPTAMIIAITGGWALGGASSPFTATTLLIGGLGGVSATHVGLRWNGLYTLICGALISALAVGYGAL